MSEEQTEILYNPEAQVILKHYPYGNDATTYVSSADSISKKLRGQELRINTLNGHMSYIREFLEEKLTEGEGADHESLCELAKEIDVEITKSVNLRVDMQFEIDVDISVWEDARNWAENHLEFDLSSDGSITYASIQDVEEM
jgi:hypothetical protein